tara:strand:+ start:201 stop:2042 length:1842 start_codon:yes stop_codon:yes gene_type:complete
MSRRNRTTVTNQPTRNTAPRNDGITLLPPLHDSQKALVNKAMKSITKNDNRITFQIVGYEDPITGKGKPGCNKTRPTGAISRGWMEIKTALLDGPVLTVFVGSNVLMTKEHAADMGARSPMTPFQLSDTVKMIKLTAELARNQHATINMTAAMLKALIPKDDATFEKLNAFIAAINIKAMLLVLDEAHKLYKDPSNFPTVLTDARAKVPIPIEVLGITSTTGYGKQSYEKGVIKLYGQNVLPRPLMYKPDQYAALMRDLKPFPDAPSEWETIDVGSPVGKPICAALIPALHGGIIKLFVAQNNKVLRPNDPDMVVTARNLIHTTLTQMTTVMAIGDDGGVLIDFVTRGDMMVRVADGGTAEAGARPAGDPMSAKESVMIALATSQAENTACDMLENIASSGVNSNPLSVHDLLIDPRKGNEIRRVLTAINASFMDNTKTTVTVIGQSMHEGTNIFSKEFTTGIIIGNMDTDPMLQIFARMGRSGTMLGNGMLVPVEFKAVNIRSTFADQVARIDDKTGSRGVAIPADINDKYADLCNALTDANMNSANSDIRINVQKLLKADSYLQTNGDLAKQYINALWDMYLSGEQQSDAEEAAAAPTEDEDDEDEDGDCA